MTIFIGSTNPVKINATRQAAINKWPDVQVHGISVPSGVSDQPKTDDETHQGAINRAKAALAAGLEQNPDLDDQVLGIGLEGGVYFSDDKKQVWSTVWGAVTDQEGNTFTSNGARFLLPEPVAQLLREGKEMGPAVGAMAGQANLKHEGGMIGVVTADYTNRTESYQAIATFTLGLWYGRDWANDLPKSS